MLSFSILSDLENVDFVSFLTRRYNGVLWKMHFLGLPSFIKFCILKKKNKNGSQFFVKKLTQYGSMIEVYIVYIKAKL